MKLSVGDRVLVVEDHNLAKVGMVGVVRDTECDPEYVGVDFGTGFNGHSLKGKIETETGWYVPCDHLELIEPATKGTGRAKTKTETFAEMKIKMEGGYDFLTISETKSHGFIVEVTTDPLDLDQLDELARHIGNYVEERKREGSK